MKTKKITIEDTFDRKVLGEGRNYGIGFALLTPTENGFKTILPFSACKDYMNDVVYIENTTNKLGKVHGFEHEYTGVYKDKDCFYLGVKAVNYNNTGKTWEPLKKASKTLLTNTENLLTIVNKFEDSVKVSKERVTLVGNTEDAIIFKLPIVWFSHPALLSAITLCIRCFFNVIKEHTLGSFEKAVVDHSSNIMIKPDSMMIGSLSLFTKITFLKRNLKLEFPIKPSNKNQLPGRIHNGGMVAFMTMVNQNKLKKQVKSC